MPPSNTAFATALDLGASLPINNTQSDINDGGTNFTVFYKFTCPAGLTMVWAWATSDNVAGYMPKTVPYDQAQVEILTESVLAPLPNNPIQFTVTPGQIHYLQVVKNADSAGPEHVDLQVRAVPNNLSIPYESIVVNGDKVGQPVGIFSPSTNYSVTKFIKGIAIGEGGCITKTGKTLFDNRVLSDRKLKLYDASYNELGTNDILAFAWIRRNQITGFFWVMVNENAGFAKLYKINPDVLPLAKTLVATLTGAGNGAGIATNNIESIAYYGLNASGGAVKKWNLLTDTSMADLVAAPNVNALFLDILVLEDDTIIVGWSDAGAVAAGTVSPRRYSTAGALLNTYGPFNSFEAQYGIVRLAYAPDTPAAFWVKLRERSGSTATGNAIFKKIRVSDGAELASVLHMEYNERNYIGPAAASYPGESGIWNSCPFVVYPLGDLSPSGLYQIVPDKRTDHNVGIPNPTFKTALMP